MPTRVYIATTQGPAEVRVLAKEQPRMPGQGHEIYSDVYLSDPFEKLPIAEAYKDFVRKPTGVIERLFGHPVYMLELSRRIVDGHSWKLGAFAAHALLDAGQLAQRDAPADRAIWLTGSVDRGGALRVGSVEHVEQKLESSAELVKACRDAGTPLTCFLPAEDLARLDASWLAGWRRDLDVDEERVSLVPVRSALELGELLALPRLAELARGSGEAATAQAMISTLAADFADDGPLFADDDAKPATRPRARWWTAVALLVGAAMLLAALAAYPVVGAPVREWVELARTGRYAKLETALDAGSGTAAARLFEALAPWLAPTHDAFALEAEARRLVDGRNCALFPGEPTETVGVERVGDGDGEFRAIPHAGLCATAYRVRNTAGRPLHLWLQVAPLAEGRRFQRQREQGRTAGARVGPGQALTLTIEARAFASATTAYRIFAVASEPASGDILSLLPGVGSTTEADWSSLPERLERLTLATHTSTHEVVGAASVARP